ncbi:MAG: hypothetical protein VX916_00340 [Planctomycetota bacterium]|nr:hypothetical protein [Planctomycetota bacterium]
MLLDRWRARRGIRTRNPPNPVSEPPSPLLTEAVEGLKEPAGTPYSMGDPNWHYRWDGALQLVGIDATNRSRADVRQRLVRLVHECDLAHMSRKAKRVLAVVLCHPEEGNLRLWHSYLDDGSLENDGAWPAARRRVAVLAMDDQGHHRLFGGDRDIERAVEQWAKTRG